MTFTDKIIAMIVETQRKNEFPQTVVSQLHRVHDEVDEAIEAYLTKSSEDFAEELADTLSFILTAAYYANVDLEKALYKKATSNVTRVWTKKE
jgi:NTP pyrophosphatase (non-canonical NTP hydrolase)